MALHNAVVVTKVSRSEMVGVLVYKPSHGQHVELLGS